MISFVPAILLTIVPHLMAGDSGAATISLSRPMGGNGETISVTGTSDCSIMYVTMVYDDYSGDEQAVTVEDPDAQFKERDNRYHYAVSFPVPDDANLGDWYLFADSFCGPSEQFPPSEKAPFTVTRSSADLRAPAEVTVGQQFRVALTKCFGATEGSTLGVAWPDGSVASPLWQAAGSGVRQADVFVPTDMTEGMAILSSDATDCRGSTVSRRNVMVIAKGDPPTATARPAQTATERTESASEPSQQAFSSGIAPATSPTGKLATREPGRKSAAEQSQGRGPDAEGQSDFRLWWLLVGGVVLVALRAALRRWRGNSSAR